MTDEELLNDLYYVKKNYDGVEGLYKKSKVIHPSITKSFVSEWLKKQQSNQVTFKKIEKKSFLPIYSEKPYAFQIDLTFFPRYKKQNNGYEVLFTAINVNTRFVYAYYSKDKTGDVVLEMLKEMEKKTIINSITCDEGSEFKNRDFLAYCKKNDIEVFLIKDDSHKLGIVNRFHRTLKDKLTKHFISTDSVNWVDIIDELIYNYNHSVNRGIGIEPYKITNAIEHEIIMRKIDETERMDKNDIFEVNDRVRIINKSVLFQDKMLAKYSNSLFTVIKVKKNSCIVEKNGKEIEVKNDQLLKVKSIDNEKEIVEIPKILKEKKIENKLKRVEVEPSLILREKRVTKKPEKLNL